MCLDWISPSFLLAWLQTTLILQHPSTWTIFLYYPSILIHRFVFNWFSIASDTALAYIGVYTLGHFNFNFTSYTQCLHTKRITTSLRRLRKLQTQMLPLPASVLKDGCTRPFASAGWSSGTPRPKSSSSWSQLSASCVPACSTP